MKLSPFISGKGLIMTNHINIAEINKIICTIIEMNKLAWTNLKTVGIKYIDKSPLNVANESHGCESRFTKNFVW